MDDISPTNRRMTYAELGQARGITTGSAEQLARRRRWPRQLGNDGLVRVLVPLGEDCVTPRHKGANKPPTKPPNIGEVIGGDEGPVISPLSEGAITGAMTGPMTAPDIGDLIHKAIREAVTPLAAQLEHDRAEIRDLRQQLSDATAAERIARDEAAGLRAELDARKQWGLWRRVRGR